ncbi:MAG TPA: phosphatase PAP2 family protein [Candidatus Levybacteria bacterium]|nr:phosphatase PAP2 family protein [Candidatus Levybacteria bacterium]
MLPKITLHHILFALTGVSFILLFFAFTFIVRADFFTSFDFDTTHRLQNITPLQIDPFFSLLSVIGRFEYTLPFLIIILALVYRKFIGGIIAFGLFGFGHVLELIGKTILDHPGPPNMFLRSQYADFPGLHVHTDASYPSGHSMRTVILGILLIYWIYQTKRLHMMVKTVLISGILGLVSLMLYSRISLGEHWTTDVIGGSILGVGIGLLSLTFLNKEKKKEKSVT